MMCRACACISSGMLEYCIPNTKNIRESRSHIVNREQTFPEDEAIDDRRHRCLRLAYVNNKRRAFTSSKSNARFSLNTTNSGAWTHARVQHPRVGDEKGGHPELFECNLGEPLAVCGSVPCRLSCK
jgi:hypothetical protein